MKIAFVGPEGVVDRIAAIGKEAFPRLECPVLKYGKHTEVIELLSSYEGKADAVMFSGKAPYRYYEHYCKDRPERLGILDYIPRHRTTLYKVLMEIAYKLRRDIRRLSIDTYSEKIFRNLYREIGVDFNTDNFYFAEQRLQDPAYVSYVTDFHRDNYRSGRVDCCVSSLLEVYQQLQAENIPCALAVPEEEVVIQSIRNLQLRVIAQQSSDNQIVVIAVHMIEPSSLLTASEDEYLFLSQRVKVLERLYAFNSRIYGVVVERGNEFLIFTTRKQIERETENYHTLDLSASLREIEMLDVYIGIGYGTTANESKRNAFEGLKKAQSYPSGSAFVIFENREMIGPLEAQSSSGTEDTIDRRFYQISKEAGISANTLHRILSIVLRSESVEYTSRELSALTGIGIRSMDRIIQKLTDAGYCEIVGEKQMSRHGRPSRILRFDVTKIEPVVSVPNSKR